MISLILPTLIWVPQLARDPLIHERRTGAFKLIVAGLSWATG